MSTLSNNLNDIDTHILTLGPIENKDDLSRTGGVIVLFIEFLQQLDRKGISFSIIDTNKAHYANRIVSLLSIWWALFSKSRNCSHISLHGTANDYIFIAPVAVLCGKIFGKPVSLRKFAGDFDKVYEALPIPLRIVVAWALKNSAVNWFETQYLVNYFTMFNPKTYWFPNVRRKPEFHREGKYAKRFLFVGNITKEKGIVELLNASNQLDDTFTIHLYGTINPDMREFDFSSYNARYQRALRHDEVLKTMAQYDILILPSYREGYPGVIIEALSVGLPIIASNLSGIREMIDEKCARFVQPGNVTDIVQAITYFNNVNYLDFSENALKFFEPFDSDLQSERYFQQMI